MFDWLNPDGKFVVALPFKIYFGATFPLMIILALFISAQKWFRWAVDQFPGGELQQWLKHFKLCQSESSEAIRSEA
jgi:hypothetical protein